MDPRIAAEAAATPLQAAMDSVHTAVAHMIKLVDDGALSDLGAQSLVGLLQDWERIRNIMPVVDRSAIQYGTELGVPEVLTQRSMTQVLVSGLRLSGGEARQRVKAAEHLADRHTMQGEPLEPIRPHLSIAQRDGVVTPEQVAVIDDALRKVRHCEVAEIEAGEQILVEAATHLDPKELRLVADRVVEAIDPDGTLPDDAEQHRRRFLHLAQRKDGSWAGDFRLTPELGRKLKELLDPLMRPATTTQDTDRGSGNDRPCGKFVEDDDRSHGQRRHDALGTVLDRLLRRDDNPDAGGTPATLIISMSYQDLITQLGVAHYGDGTPVPVKTALRLAEQAEIAWCFTDAKGAVLDLYRTRRIATKDQTLALYARDGGCSFPGCSVEPQWCERHHIIPWWLGGVTNLNNLTLLCAFHHHQFERRGWQCRIEDGLPVWIPPKWIDREQRPVLHPRITTRHWSPQDPLDL